MRVSVEAERRSVGVLAIRGRWFTLQKPVPLNRSGSAISEGHGVAHSVEAAAGDQRNASDNDNRKLNDDGDEHRAAFSHRCERGIDRHTGDANKHAETKRGDDSTEAAVLFTENDANEWPAHDR